MSEEETIRTIVEWCLEDDAWKKAFGFNSPEGQLYSFGGYDQEPEWTEPHITIDIWLHKEDIGDHWKAIPLTQLLLSSETVRVCLEKAGPTSPVQYGEDILLFGAIALAKNRIEWYQRILVCPALANEKIRNQPEKEQKGDN